MSHDEKFCVWVFCFLGGVLCWIAALTAMYQWKCVKAIEAGLVQELVEYGESRGKVIWVKP